MYAPICAYSYASVISCMIISFDLSFQNGNYIRKSENELFEIRISLYGRVLCDWGTNGWTGRSLEFRVEFIQIGKCGSYEIFWSSTSWRGYKHYVRIGIRVFVRCRWIAVLFLFPLRVPSARDTSIVSSRVVSNFHYWSREKAFFRSFIWPCRVLDSRYEVVF